MRAIVRRRVRRGLWLAGHLGLGALIAFGWLGLLTAVRSRRVDAQRRRWVRWWMTRLLRGLAIELRQHGTPHGRTALLVANHISWLDIPCLLARVDAIFVAKAEVARWPLIGRLATRVGTLFLERGHGAPCTAATMAKALAAGEAVMIFPEGTSTDGSNVRHFHSRLFRAALDAAVPVQAVAIRYPHPAGTHPAVPFVGDDSFVPHLWRLLGEEPIVAELRFFAPVASAGCDRRRLAEWSRRQIAGALRDEHRAAAVTDRSPLLQSAVMADREHGGPEPPETRPWKTPTTTGPASPAPGASSSTACIPH